MQPLDDFDFAGLGGPPARPAWPPRARWAAGCGAGCALLVLLEGLVLWGGLVFFFSLRPPPGFAARIQAPAVVTAGRKFPLKVVLHNAGQAAATVTNITADRNALAQLTLENPQPAPATPGVLMWGSQAWSYQKSLAPGEKWTVTFDATAQKSGPLNGALQIQVNFLPKSARFKLEAKPAVKKP